MANGSGNGLDMQFAKLDMENGSSFHFFFLKRFFLTRGDYKDEKEEKEDLFFSLKNCFRLCPDRLKASSFHLR